MSPDHPSLGCLTFRHMLVGRAVFLYSRRATKYFNHGLPRNFFAGELTVATIFHKELIVLCH